MLDRSLAVALSLCALSLASAPSAQPLPLSYARRPLTLPRSTLRADVDVSLTALGYSYTTRPAFNCASDGATCEVSEPPISLTTGLGLGVGFGFTDDFELGATVLPLVLSPEVVYAGPSVYAGLRFTRGVVEVGARLALLIPFRSPLSVSASVPVLIHAGRAVRVDTGAGLTVDTSREAPQVAINLPVGASVNVARPLFLGVRSGLNVWVDAGVFTVPLGAFVGYTLSAGGEMPRLDLVASFELSRFLAHDRETEVYTRAWTAALSARVYFDLASR